MKWKDMDLSAKNVLERCWRFDDDQPLSFTVSIGDVVYGQTVTEETYAQIFAYRKGFPYFDVTRKNDELTVSGNCLFGTWLKK